MVKCTIVGQSVGLPLRSRFGWLGKWLHMQVEKKEKGKRISFRLSDEAFVKLKRQFDASTCQKWSEFIRAVLLEKPLTVYTRNRSLDELVETLRELKPILVGLLNVDGGGIAALAGAQPDWVAVKETVMKIESIMEQVGRYWIGRSSG